MQSKLIPLLFLFTIILFSCTKKKEDDKNNTTLQIHGVRFEPMNVNTSASFRGLFAVNDSVVWASGSQGTVIKTTNGGESWEIFKIAEEDSIDFRDIHAFSDQKAYILSAGQPARLYITTDGGNSWSLQYENKNPEAFFDGFDFWNERVGIAMSDPVGGKFLIITTQNGKEWHELDSTSAPKAKSDEGSFAASGTTIVTGNSGVARIAVSGPEGSRILLTEDFGATWESIPHPVHSELQYAGIYSMAFREEIGMAVGGSFAHPDSALNNAAMSPDGGKSWELLSQNAISGYRSCIAWLPFSDSSWITVSRTGGEFTNDDGQSWTTYDSENTYFSFSIARNGSIGYASGANGKIAKVHFDLN